MEKEFKFKNGDAVRIVTSSETGRVIGRADYLEDAARYEVEYKSAIGSAKTAWFTERQLEAA